MSEQHNRSPSSLLDPEQLQMLIEAGAAESVELFREILDLFEEESRRKLEELAVSHESGDFETMGRSAHALAGSSANIGGREVWQQAKKIEDLCKEGNGQAASRLLPQLQVTYDRTIEALRAYSDRLD
jgi:HPt (histidine-containing phosphotransfer) domain-containing protein